MTSQPATHSLLSDWLEQLGVPHTTTYTDNRFGQMPFQSAFGLTKLMAEYGIDSEGVVLADKSELLDLQPPFLADTPQGFVIVTQATHTSVSYITQGESEQIATADFLKAWNGMVLLAFPHPDACEPDYRAHRAIEMVDESKQWVMWIGAVLLLVYAFAVHGLWHSPWAYVIALLDIGGLWLTVMLEKKSLDYKSKKADAVCGVLQKGGCDRILELKASSFFGIVKWSEVGLTYFAVSLGTLLLLPHLLPELAVINLCCLPFTVWSIWYQHWKAHHWCTLCVSVQATLWLLFFTFLGGGWLAEGLHKFDMSTLIAMGVTYLTVLLAANRLLPNLANKSATNQDETQNQADNSSAA